MTTPKISIYATVYNNANTVEFALNSIIKQLHNFEQDFEFVIVDNYSTDGTFEIIRNFEDNYKNFKVIRAKCSRGKGRKIAFEKTRGEFIFYVDLDTIYLPSLSKIIAIAPTICGNNAIINCPAIGLGFMRRELMDKIGGWRDINMTEDIEFFARAINKGIKLCIIPIHCFSNQIMAKRERRYSKNILEYYNRLTRNAQDKILGNGIVKIKYVKRSKATSTILACLLFARLSIFGKKTYNYSEYPNNEEYLLSNAKIIDPAIFGISKEHYVMEIVLGRIAMQSYGTCNLLLTKLFELGFNRISYLNGRSLLVYSDRTNKEIVKYYGDFLSIFPSSQSKVQSRIYGIEHADSKRIKSIG